ncbi:hypothetical protein DSM14862_00278 [Sulfitobacter indolifex]|nr:RES family NAD+ phosphorylase [Sulfitobacter indolifex]UOA17528.1 hypothetical protein DSM14862_00278 [Sulfitobacter indolifex]
MADNIPEMKLENSDKAVEYLNSFNDSALDYVSDNIRDFCSLQVNEITQEKADRVVDQLLDVYFVLPMTLSEAGFDTWRVRPSDREQSFVKFSDAAAPPPEKAATGRANAACESVFYCGSSPETCFAESRLAKGDTFHLFRYNLIQGRKLSLVSIGDYDSIRRRGRTILQSPIIEKGCSDILKRLKPNVRLAVQLVDAFFFDQINRKGNADQYRITQTIFRAISSGLEVDGVMYPSVEHSGGTNFALKQNAYEEKVLIQEANIQMVKKSYGYGAYRCSKFGPAMLNYKESLIEWPNVPDWWHILDEVE